jgi:hypothetical protein
VSNLFSRIMDHGQSGFGVEQAGHHLSIKNPHFELPLLLITFGLLIFAPTNHKVSAHSSLTKLTYNNAKTQPLSAQVNAASPETTPSENSSKPVNQKTSSVSVVTNSTISSSSTSSPAASTNTSLNVNGNEINVPANGNVNQTINTADGQTSVVVNNSQSSSGSSFSSNVTSTSDSANDPNNQGGSL